MTIKLTEDEFWGQFQETDEEQLQWNASNGLNNTLTFNSRLAQGWWRNIWLREGIYIGINQAQHSDRIIIKSPEREYHYVRCCFVLSGKLQQGIISPSSKIVLPKIAGKYLLRSNGLNRQTVCDCSEVEPYSEVIISILPSVLHSFVASSEKELPFNLQHLVRASDEPIYGRTADIQPMMNTVLQQILHCPYKGLVKRAYLESKAIELMALVLDREIAIAQKEPKKFFLKPEQIERIHYAKEILLRDLNNPPSLEELARLAGLNDFMLKQGFHHCFGTSVFRVLRSHRLEMARQLLAEQDITVTEVAKLVGYASMRSFARAFRQQFGISPKQYQKACRK